VPLVLGKDDGSALRNQSDNSLNGSRGKSNRRVKKIRRKEEVLVNARFIKVKAKNFGKLPADHPGFEYNGEAFIFVDEIIINPEVMELL